MKYDIIIKQMYSTTGEITLKEDETYDCKAEGYGGDFIALYCFTDKDPEAIFHIYYKDIEYLERIDGEYEVYDDKGKVIKSNIKS